MIYLKHFKTLIDYNIYKNSYEFVLPNISSCEEDLDFIVYNPEDEEFGSGSGSGSGSGNGSSEPALEENQVLCKYNVTDTNTSITLLHSNGSGTSTFSSMIVDDVEQEVTNEYIFDTEGEHTVLFKLAENVTSIGDHTFYECSGLTSITIPDSVTSIGDDAFQYCSGLISVTIGNSVTSIGDRAFGCCSELTSISVAANNQKYDSRNNCNAIIETSTNKLIAGCKNTIIPNSVTSIGDYAFRFCSNLTSITIPNSVTSIGYQAFYNCSGLTSVTIGNSVTSIGSNAFASCSGLTSITIPDSVTSIGDYAFNICDGLTSVYISNSVTSIGNYAFHYCSRLTSITCNTITAPTIQNNTFKNIKTGGILTVPAGSTGYDVWMGTGNYYLGKYDWNKIEVLERNKVLCKYNVTSTASPTTLLYSNGSGTSTFSSMIVDGVEQEITNSYTFDTSGEHTILFTLAEGVTSIGENTFWNCSELTSITIGNSVISIGNYAFTSCHRLTSITIPDSVTSIGNYAFSDCYGLTSITIPDLVTSIGQGTFRSCSELTSITIPNSVTSIGKEAFYNCGLTNITIGDSVTSIGKEAFYSCRFASITIPNSVTSIGNNAFYNCGLTSITIGNSLTSIGSQAFCNCPLTSISVYPNNQTYDSRNNCNAIIETSTNKLILGCKNTIIPNTITSIGDSAFEACYSLTSITIPDSVTSIGSNAFNRCSNLISITCNATTAPTIQSTTFQYIARNGILTVPSNAIGYDNWLSSSSYYLGYYNWIYPINEEDKITAKYNVTSTSSSTKLFNNTSNISYLEVDGTRKNITGSYTFNTTGKHTIKFVLNDPTLIESSAFYQCFGLTSITIPDSVTSISNYAFQGCSGLTSITIPDSVTSIDNSAFQGCSGLTSIVVDQNNQTYDSRNNCNAIIETSTNKLILGCKNTIIPDSVTSIGSGAFWNCFRLTSITIPDSVTSIGSNAFNRCSGLTSIIIPDSVTSIGNYAFYGCSGLISITCNTMTAPTIVSGTFYDIKSGGTLIVPVGSTGYDVWMGTGNYYLGYYNWNKVEVLKENQVLCKYNVTSTTSTIKLLNNTSSFASMLIDGVEQSEVISSYTFDTTGEHTILFTLAKGVRSIGEETFYYCSGLTSVTIGNSVTLIGSQAFNNCHELTSITIPNSVTSIGEEAFYYCYKLASITIPNSVTSIGNNAFNNCLELTSITIPNSVTSIGSGAFAYCGGLTSISVAANNQKYDSRNNCNAIIEKSTNKLIVGCKNTIIPNSVKSIGESAFAYCFGLTSITIPDSVTSIGNYAFYQCSKLTNITIPDSVTSIGYYVFSNCSGLTSVTIGNSVTSIGTYTFSYCSKLISITCNAMIAPTITSNTFRDLKYVGTLNVPVGSTGYDVWMGTGNYYLGKYGWTKVEQ